jgi:hypothetical protein
MMGSFPTSLSSSGTWLHFIFLIQIFIQFLEHIKPHVPLTHTRGNFACLVFSCWKVLWLTTPFPVVVPLPWQHFIFFRKLLDQITSDSLPSWLLLICSFPRLSSLILGLMDLVNCPPKYVLFIVLIQRYGLFTCVVTRQRYLTHRCHSGSNYWIKNK